MNELLSVVVITYNQPQYLYRLLDTIFEQTYPCIELIISDDGTKDFDHSPIDEYITRHAGSNIVSYRVIHSERNQGTVRNINQGIKSTTGSFIKIIAGDDLYPSKHVFSNQMNLFETNPNLVIVSGKIRDCLEDETIVFTKGIEDANRLQEKVFAMAKEKRGKFCYRKRIAPYAIQTLCFRKSFFDEYGLFDETYFLMEDAEMMSRIIQNDIPIATINDLVVLHRLNSGVSNGKAIISSRSKRYYEDTKVMYKKSYTKERNIYWKLIYRNHYSIACYRIEMTDCDRNGKLLCTLKYLPSLLLYSITNLDVFTKRFSGLIRSFKD